MRDPDHSLILNAVGYTAIGVGLGFLSIEVLMLYGLLLIVIDTFLEWRTHG